jgi:hypothetical protein
MVIRLLDSNALWLAGGGVRRVTQARISGERLDSARPEDAAARAGEARSRAAASVVL